MVVRPGICMLLLGRGCPSGILFMALVAQPAGWSEREAAVWLRDKPDIRGGCLPSLTLTGQCREQRDPIPVKHLMKTITTVWLIFITTLSMWARPVPYWPYDKLNREADLLVIATPVSVRDTGEKTTLPGIMRGNQPVDAIGMETTFEVLAPLKGPDSPKRIVFYHLREDSPSSASANGPALVSFDPKEKKRYLLFLRKEKMGQYVALTGQTDPAGSVKDLGTHP
jgi:hypothetical protein